MYTCDVTSPDELLAERARLEAEIVGLTTMVGRATARLDSLRASGPEPRGLIPGVFAGGLVVVAGVLWFLYLVAGVLSHD
jgi:hypothetical protein